MAAVNGVIPPGERAPAFRLPLLAGGEASLPASGARGLALAVFHKKACPTCRLVFPFLQRLHDQVAPAGGLVAGISQDGPHGAAAFARELGLTLPILVDGEDWPVSRRYDLLAVPTLYLLDQEGIVRSSAAGFSRKGLQTMADDLAASVGAPTPVLYAPGEAVPEMKPG